MYFRTVFDSFDPDYILKTDDDLYTRCVLPDQLRSQAMRSVLQSCKRLCRMGGLSWCLTGALKKHWHLGQSALLAGVRCWAPCGWMKSLLPVLQEGGIIAAVSRHCLLAVILHLDRANLRAQHRHGGLTGGRVERLPPAMREWEADAGDYIGCSFIGGEMYDRPRHRFFEPLSFIFGKREYYLFFSGGAVPRLAVTR